MGRKAEKTLNLQNWIIAVIIMVELPLLCVTIVTFLLKYHALIVNSNFYLTFTYLLLCALSSCKFHVAITSRLLLVLNNINVRSKLCNRSESDQYVSFG